MLIRMLLFTLVVLVLLAVFSLGKGARDPRNRRRPHGWRPPRRVKSYLVDGSAAYPSARRMP